MKAPIPQQAFKLAIDILPADIDAMNHVNNVVYLQWVQNISAAHWNTIATPAQKKEFSWVALRHEIDYLAPAVFGDQVVAYTWVGEAKGPKFDRFVKICHAITGRTFAQSKTTWCLLDGSTLKPKRIPIEIFELLQIHSPK